MEFSSILRSKLFWAIDLMKGNNVGRHYKDLVEFDTRTHAENSKRLENRLQAILNFASQNVAYYQNCGFKKLSDFPVVDKNIIKNNLPEFFSNGYTIYNSIPAITSGSTGTPFTVYHDKEKKFRNSADTLFFAEKAGYQFGAKLYYFKIWSDLNKKSSLLRLMQNIEAVDVLTLDGKCQNVIDDILKRSNSIHFLGYTSAIENLCRFVERNKDKYSGLKISSIITMSESLNDYTRILGEKLFHCPVISRYSNIENGILAQQTLENKNDFTINNASYKLEILEEKSNCPVKHGEFGRIVVTDLFNKAMPLIRYDTGDIGVMELREEYGGKLVLSHIEGRKLDQIYNTKGELISSYIVYKNMWKYPELDQYQFVQISKNKYQFKISIKDQFQREDMLVKEFKSYLGDDADFTIEYVSEIPLLASGKRKKVVNLMNS